MQEVDRFGMAAMFKAEVPENILVILQEHFDVYPNKTNDMWYFEPITLGDV